MYGYQPKPGPNNVKPPPRDPSGQREAFVLEVERANATLTLAQQLLPPITKAPSRDAVAITLAAGRDEIMRLVSVGELSVNQARTLRALLEMSAEERLRELPAPGAPKPVGLLGDRNA